MAPQQPLEAIFFDIDDTLFSTSIFAEKARLNAIDAMIHHGLRADRDEAMRELQEVIAEFSSNYDQHFDKLLLRLPPASYAGINPALLVAAGVIAYHETKIHELKVFDDAYLLLRDLGQARRPRLGIISAGLTIKQMEKIIRLQIYRFLDPEAIFISDQVGISKPNPKLYLKACEHLGIVPERAMYIGDSPPNDVDPPSSIGMVTVWHRRGGKHDEEATQTVPTYTIRSYHELREILIRDFGLALPPP